MKPECANALDQLQRSLEAGAGLDPEACAHFEACSACRSSLGAALSGLAEPVAPTRALDDKRAEVEVRIRHRRRLVTRGLGVAGILAALLLGWSWRLDAIRYAPFLDALALGLLVLGAVIFPLMLGLWLVRLPVRHGFYKRLCKGRQLSGVCLGLAERTCTPVSIWRLGFLALCLLPTLPGAGIWLYALLALAMPVHPEDRPSLFRYRVARWWRGLRAGKALAP